MKNFELKSINNGFSDLNRRDFLRFSGMLVGVAGSSMLSGISLGAVSKDAYAIANVWCHEQGGNRWENYYQKFVRLMQSEAGINTRWLSNKPKVTLAITLNEQPYPFSSSPKLVYSAVRYLLEEVKIPAEAITFYEPQYLHQRQQRLHISGIAAAVDRAVGGSFHKQWVDSIDEVSHLIDLSSVSLRPMVDASNDRLSNSYRSKTRLVVSSTTRMRLNNHSNSPLIEHQPGMMLASNHQLPQQLLTDYYLKNNHKLMMNHSDSSKLRLDWYCDCLDAPLGLVESIERSGFIALTNRHEFA